MSKEVITDQQGIAILILFILGSSVVLGIGVEAGKDLWISVIVAIMIALPILIMYARLLALYPGQDFYEILESLFGKYIGKILIGVYTWFSFHLGTLVLRNFGSFVNTVGLPKTPEIIPMIFLGTLCIWIIKEGIEVLGRWSKFFVTYLTIIIIGTILFLLKEANISNIKPVLANGLVPVLQGSFSVLTFPLVETIVFAIALKDLQSTRSSYKIMVFGLLIGGSTLLLTTLNELLVLGFDLYSTVYFPSYLTVARLNIGFFVQRLEIISAVAFLISGFVKISVCLLAASKGVARIFGEKNYRFLVTPIGILMMNLAYFIYDSIIEMFQWATKIWAYYAFPFQVIIPVGIYIYAEVKAQQKKRQQSNNEG